MKMEENMKPKSAAKVKERRQPYSQDGVHKRVAKPNLTRSDLLQFPPPQPLDNTEPVRKILSEANKIVKIGMEKEYALLERENTLQSSNELVENLRKNILHLQMEYEKLDQNYQREISHRSELIKRMDATQENVNSVMQCSEILSKSLKQLEADKFKIAEFYEIIYHNQKEVETKHAKVEKFIKEQEDLLKTKLESIKKNHENILSQHSETVFQLSKKLNYANDREKVAANENEKLLQRIEEFKQSSKRYESLLDQEKKLNREHEENTFKLKSSLKKAKFQRFKYQKLWREKKCRSADFVRKIRILKKSLKNTEFMLSQCSEIKRTLESKNCEWEKQFEKHLEEDNSLVQNWEKEKSELRKEKFDLEAVIESLGEENKNLREKLLELNKMETSKQSELEQIQNDLSKLLSENLKLKDEMVRYSEENNEKNTVISELQRKAKNSHSDFKAEIEYLEKERETLQQYVRQLENKMAEFQEKIEFEKKDKETLIYNFNCKSEESIKEYNQKVTDLGKLLEEKTALIEKLQSELNLSHNSGKSLEELSNQLMSEQSKNEELNKNIEILRGSQNILNQELEKAKTEISEYIEKVSELGSLNKALTLAQMELETNATELSSEIEQRKKSFEALEEKQKKAERELNKMNKILEENSALKASLANTKNLLEGTEARVEAYKVVVRKLESDKIVSQNAHSEEVSKLKAEMARVEEMSRLAMTAKPNRESSRMLTETPKKNFDVTNKKGPETPVTKSKQEKTDFFTQKSNSKENEPEISETDKWQNTSTPPTQSAKKFLSTPRKIFTSTPQPHSRNMSSVEKKKRDPYDFDSDSSVEKLDSDKVLKVLNRQKREHNKRSKTNK